ncbi:MAG: threonine aldolase family protein [Burkholderiales bacterium]
MIIDLRSDAVTRPTDEMWDAMRAAPLGWAAVGEDKNVHALEEAVADLLGKEAAFLVPSGTTSNLLAVIGQAERGEQVIFDDLSHILWAEEWGFAFVGGVVHREVRQQRGRMTPADVEAAILLHSFNHRPRTSLVCLENTHNAAGGAVLPPEHVAAVAAVARRHGARVHLDGARILNAAAALSVDVKQLVKDADSVSFNLNKGLSAPMGALLCGGRGLVERARLNFKRIGGGNIHQAGIYAAAGLVALRTMIPQHAEDNRRAKHLASTLAKQLNQRFSLWPVESNIVFLTCTGARALQAQLKEAGVLVSLAAEDTVRMVAHRHVDDGQVDLAADTIRKIANTAPT